MGAFLFHLMGFIDRIKADIKRYTTNSEEFGVIITISAHNGETADIVGLHTKHHLGVDSDGNLINSRTAHVSFSEDAVIDANASYPLRNAKGELDIKKHIITVTDSTGIAKSYIITQAMPDETTGLIVCVLGAYINVTSNTYVVDDYVEDYFI